ncbi:recombination-associated protein RdgC [Deferrisoma camini]|uniref:recombination-associated protein RdgC n=1 Tax=Deferrisoma camini TaxID=1035120 RepID=UPI00046CEB56|nr:recombination-associated protein RdgC [Deferrisoma camini]
MGLLSGGIRMRRYRVMGDVPPDFRDRYEEAIQTHAFQDFAPDDEREQVAGWVGVDDWFEPGLPLDRWLVGNTICLTLRVDTKRIPSKYFKLQCRRREAEWRLKAGREDLTRAERDEIAALVRKELLERVIPSVQGTDMVWDLDRREAWFWSTAEKANETFRTLFERTFGLRLRPLFPYSLALEVLGEDRAEVLDRVAPAWFAPGGGS